MESGGPHNVVSRPRCARIGVDVEPRLRLRERAVESPARSLNACYLSHAQFERGNSQAGRPRLIEHPIREAARRSKR